MLKVKQTTQKAGLAKQGSSIRAQAKKKVYVHCKQNLLSWEEYREATCRRGEGIHVAKAQLEAG